MSGIEVDIKLGEFPSGHPLVWEPIYRESYRKRQVSESPLVDDFEFKEADKINRTFSLTDIRKIFNDLASDLLQHHLKGEVHLQIHRGSVHYVHLDQKYKFKWPGAKVASFGEVQDFEKSIPYDGSWAIPEIQNYQSPQMKAGSNFNPFKADVFMLGMLILDIYLFLRKASVGGITSLNTNEAGLKKAIDELSLVLEPALIIENNNVVHSGQSLFKHLLAFNEEERLDLVVLTCRYQLNLLRQHYVPLFGYDGIEWIKSSDEPEPEDRLNDKKNFNYGILKYPDGSFYSGLLRNEEVPENKKKVVVKSDDQKDDGFEDTDEEQELQDEFPIRKITHEEFPYRDGRGRLYNSCDALVYDGEWKRNLPNGQGTLHFNRYISVEAHFTCAIPMGKMTVHYGATKSVPLNYGVKVDGGKMETESTKFSALPNGKYLWKNHKLNDVDVSHVFLVVDTVDHVEILLPDEMMNMKRLLEDKTTIHTWKRKQDERDMIDYDDKHLFMVVVPHFFEVALECPSYKKLVLKIGNKHAFDYLHLILSLGGLIWRPEELDIGNCISAGHQLTKLAAVKLEGANIKKLNISNNNNHAKPGPPTIEKNDWNAFFESALVANVEDLDISNTNIEKDAIEEVCQKLKLAKLNRIDFSHVKTYLSKALANLLANPNMKALRTIVFNDHPNIDFNDVKGAVTAPIETVELYHCPAIATESAKILSNIKSIRNLKISGRLKNEDVELITKNLPNLENLSISKNCDLADPVKSVLPAGAHLQSLNLEELEITEANFVELLTKNKFPNLRKLRVAGVYKLEAAAIEKAFNNKIGQNFPNLETLQFTDILVTDKAVVDFCSQNNDVAKCFPKLTNICFRLCDQFGDAALKALAAWPVLGHVTHFNIAYTGISDDGLKALAGSALTKGLQTLTITNCRRCTDGGFIEIIKSPHLSNLTTLKLGKNRITDGGVAAFADPKCSLTNLQVLDLNDTELITETAIFQMVTSQALKSLKVLQLADADIDEYGLKILAETRFYHNPEFRIVLFGCTNLIPDNLYLFTPSHFFCERDGLSHLNLTDHEVERFYRKKLEKGNRIKLDLRGAQGVSEFGLLWLKDIDDAKLIRKIKFHDVNFAHDYLHIISTSKPLQAGLESVTIDRTSKFTNKDLGHFFGAMPNLKRFKVISAKVQADAFPAGLKSNLEELTLINCIHLADEGATAIVNAFPKLTHLNLTNSMIKGPALDKLATLSDRLVELNMAKCGTIHPTGWATFINASKFSNLQKLDIHENFMTLKLLITLSEKLTDKMQSLNISRIRQHPGFEEDKVVEEDFTEGIEKLVRKCVNLKDLNLRGIDPMTDAVLFAIAEVSKQLETLTVSDCDHITSVGMRAIARSPLMSNLRELTIDNTYLNDEVLTFLATSPHLKTLQRRSMKGICNTYIMHRKPHAL